MEIWEIVVLSLVGIVAGWLNVLAGGGSMLTVPIMIFMGMPGPVANGTNRLAIILQNITAVAIEESIIHIELPRGKSI